MDLDLIELNAWLSDFLNFETAPDWNMMTLKTAEILCAEFGHPERTCPCFHVAGSKGKGTISADIAAILRAAGYKTGVHASPHVLHFTERVGTGAGPFPQEVYDAAYHELRSGVERLIAEGKIIREKVTWYELTTLFSMLCFREAKCDYAIYEVGMGGRLDATNVVQPVACAFGPIELEHTKFLGDTLAKIATEKAGIMKPGVPAVSVPQEEEAAAVFRERAEELNVPIFFVGRKENYLEQDAVVAKMAVLKVLPEIDEQSMDAAIARVQLPGRFEKVEASTRYPELLIDVAHTENSIREVCRRIQKEGISGDLLFGCAEDKNVEKIAEIIADTGIFKNIYLTRPGDFKKSDLPRMERAFEAAGLAYTASADFAKMIPQALAQAKAGKQRLIVLGSFYLAGEVKKIIGAR